jgi:hypothetical protein
LDACGLEEGGICVTEELGLHPEVGKQEPGVGKLLVKRVEMHAAAV